MRWFSISSLFFFSSRRRHTRSLRDWSSDVCSSDLLTTRISPLAGAALGLALGVIGGARRLGSGACGRGLRSAAEGARHHLADRSEERRVGKEYRSRLLANP